MLLLSLSHGRSVKSSEAGSVMLKLWILSASLLLLAAWLFSFCTRPEMPPIYNYGRPINIIIFIIKIIISKCLHNSIIESELASCRARGG